MDTGSPIRKLIDLALAEDVGSGDVTTRYFVPEDARSCARLVAREACVVAGLSVAGDVFRCLSSEVCFTSKAKDGDRLSGGDAALEIEGPSRAILTGERVALNFVQRLSGVATATRAYVEAVAGTAARILDTRKTAPGMRMLEKAAVLAGGGTNHRAGLFDMVMVKDNHLAACGGIAALREKIGILRREHPAMKIEIEVDSLDQFHQIAGIVEIDRILLDNMSPVQMREAVASRRPGLELEASGGISLSNAREIALTGVDFLSVGGLTHSARAIDFSLEF